MEDGQSSLSVYSDTKNGIVTVYKSVAYTWYQSPKAELYVVDSSLIDEIKEIIIEKKLYNASKAPLSEMQVLDAPTTTYNISFSEGEFFSYSSSQKLSSKVYSANEEIEALIEEYCKNAKAYPTVYVEDEEEYSFWREEEAVSIDCSNGSKFTIHLNVYNGKSEDAELFGNITISKMENERAVYTDTLIENYKISIYAQNNDYIPVPLSFEHYPEEGTYKLEYAGYETTFEMKIYKAD